MGERAEATKEAAERVRWCVEGEAGGDGRGRCGKGSGPEPLPSPPFSPWTSPAPPLPCAQKPSGPQGVRGLEPPWAGQT